MEYIEEILSHYTFEDPKITFIRHSENIVYELVDKEQKYLIRIHKPKEGFSLELHQKYYKIEDYIEGEMDVLAILNENMKIPIQEPIFNTDNKLVTILSNGLPVTVLRWLDGETVSSRDMTEDMAFNIGEMLAEMHEVFKRVDGDIDIEKIDTLKLHRYYYNQGIIDDLEEMFKKVESKGHITANQKLVIDKTLETISSIMKELRKLPFSAGIIHADVATSNLIYNKLVSPIDFSLCGYGYYMMDVGGAISNFKEIPMRQALVKGYEKQSKMEIDIRAVEAFFVSGVLLFIGIQHEHIHKEDWFEGNMKRWEETLFVPLNENRRFALVEINQKL